MQRIRFTLRELFLVITFCGVVSAIVPSCVTGHHDVHTCALCRMKRIKYVYLEITWKTRFIETACTPWYESQIESAHEHVWVHARGASLRDLSGNQFGAISRDPPGRTIWSITPEDQIAIYEHLPEKNQGRELFLQLADRATMNNNQDYDILHRLQAWKASDFHGAWQDAGED